MTGQIIARGPYPGPDGKPVWMLLGLVHDEECTLKAETQYTIAVAPVLVNPLDVSKYTLGNNATGILTQPIWRI